jgi:hypothetical protein
MTQKVEGELDKSPRAAGTLLVMIIFGCTGIVDLIAGKYVEASVWISLAAAFSFLGPESAPWPEIPQWRRVTGLVLVAVGAGLLGFQIARDFTS